MREINFYFIHEADIMSQGGKRRCSFHSNLIEKRGT